MIRKAWLSNVFLNFRVIKKYFFPARPGRHSVFFISFLPLESSLPIKADPHRMTAASENIARVFGRFFFIYERPGRIL